MPAANAGVQRIWIRHLRWAARAAGPSRPRKVIAAHDLRSGESARFDELGIVCCELRWIARATKCCMEIIDPAVEHGHLDAPAIDALGLHRSRTDVWDRRRQVLLIVPHRRNAHHARILGQRRQRCRIDFDEDGIHDGLHLSHHACIRVESAHARQESILLRFGAPLGLRSVSALDERGRRRVGGQADDDPL